MARFIMAGQLQAFSFLMLFSVLGLFVPLLSLFSNAAVALVTLRKGWRSGLSLAVAGIIALSLLTLVLGQSIKGGLQFGLVQWTPMLFLAGILHQKASWRPTLESTFFLASAGILVFHYWVPDSTAFWTDFLDKIIKPHLEANKVLEMDIEKWMNIASQWMTALVAVFVCIIWILSLLLARHWQAQLYNPGGFGKEFRAIQLSKAVAGLLLLLIALSTISQHQMAIELVACGLAVFLFQGISLIHAAVKRLELHPVILGVFYVLLLSLPLHIALLVVAFGIMDSFVDFRAKLVKK